MTNAVFNHAKYLSGTGGIDFDDAITNGYLVVLLMLSTFTFSSHKDDDQLSDLVPGTNEFDGTNYVRKYLANASWDKDATNNRSELTADPTVWASLGAGSAQVGSAILGIETAAGTDLTTIPYGYIDDGGFPFTPTGSDNTITWNAEGVAQHK